MGKNNGSGWVQDQGSGTVTQAELGFVEACNDNNGPGLPADLN